MVFDADGTLVNTTDLILNGYVETLSKNGHRKFADREYIRKCVGGTVAHTFSTILGCAEDDACIPPLVRAHDVVQDGHPEWIKSYPLVRETLLALREKGIKLGLCTSGSMYQVRRNFSAVGIDAEAMFDAMVTADDRVASKPSPQGLELVLSRLGVRPEHAVYVGDHDVDMRAARAARLAHAIGISHGFHNEDELVQAGADIVIHQIDKLLKILEEKNSKENILEPPHLV